jgi:predicted nucleic acid-binding protein
LKLVLHNALREECRAVIDHLIKDGYRLVAPTLWTYETTSTVCKAIHFGHLTIEEGTRALDYLADLGVHQVPPSDVQNRQALEWSLRLKRASAYDSYYLVLAEALECDLWTADKRLVNAVALPWVRWVGEGVT